MKRDMDLIRKILFVIESSPSYSQIYGIDGYEWDVVAEHIRLIDDAKLIRGKLDFLLSIDAERRQSAFVHGLSWAGHDFLDAARSDTNWNQARDVTKKAGGWTFDLLKQVLVEISSRSIQQAMGLPPS